MPFKWHIEKLAKTNVCLRTEVDQFRFGERSSLESIWEERSPSGANFSTCGVTIRLPKLAIAIGAVARRYELARVAAVGLRKRHR